MASDFEPTFDASAAYPEVAALRHALSQHDWAAVRAVYDPADADMRQFLVHEAADRDGAEVFLREVVQRDPDDLVATTMYAVRLVYIGWSVRTSARASQVSRQQFETFFSYLRQAEETLIWVCARDPGLTAAWCQRILTARGLQLGQSEARRRYERTVARVPHFVPAQIQLLQQLCPKWSGDMETMHAFARQCAQEAPPGARNGVLVVEAHMEHYLEVGNTSYFQDPAVRQEIVAAGERSVLHPQFQHTAGWVGALSAFAAGFSLIGDWSRAKHCFLALGPFASEQGWEYLHDRPETAFARYRARALKQG